MVVTMSNPTKVMLEPIYDSIVNELLDGLEKEIDEIIGSYVSDDEEEP